MMHKREFTAVYQKRDKYYIAWIEEIPGVNTQGKTKEETVKNLREALTLVLKANRAISSKRNNAELKRELIEIAMPA